jgi:hypothetical protein
MLWKLSKKQDETTRSLEKIERGGCYVSLNRFCADQSVCYSLRLRLIEYADRPDILKQMAKRALDDVPTGTERDE